LAISFFIDIIILLLILSGPVALLLSKIEIISMISSSLTINENLNELKTINSKTYWKTINTLLNINDIPPIQDPKNNYCLSYEGKEKADVLNKYFCSITNLVDENKTLPDFDDM
jgi:hypothetical protein